MFNTADYTAFGITLQLAAITTFLLLLLGIPLAWWLANTRSKARIWVDVFVSLPLVLPPTVLGFYLLLALGPKGPLGAFSESFWGASLAFSFPGLVIGSAVYSLPFVVQPLHSAFLSIGKRPLEVAATLGAGPLDRFFSVALPLARPGVVTAAALGFAHTIGEFGVVLMIGGNIPGETQVLSIAIYEHVESVHYAKAHLLSGTLLAVSCLLLFVIYRFQRQIGVLGR